MNKGKADSLYALEPGTRARPMSKAGTDYGALVA